MFAASARNDGVTEVELGANAIAGGALVLQAYVAAASAWLV